MRATSIKDKVFVSGIILLLLVGATSLPAFGQMVTLKAVTAWPKASSENISFFMFTDLVEQMVAKQFPGELKINYIGGPEAVKTQDQVQGLQKGMVDMVYTTNAYYVSLLPEADAMKLSPFTPAEERERGAWKYMNELHEKKLEVHFLGRLGLGEQFFLYLLKPISAADLKGLNIRESPMYLQLVKGLGGNPVVIPPTEVYVGLQRGVVDGYCWPAVGTRDWGWEKLTKYIVEPGFYQVPNPLLVNLKTWNQLQEKMRKLLTEAAKEAEKKAVAHFDDLAKKERPILLQAGLQVIDLPAAEKEKFLKVAYEEGWKDIIAKSPQAGQELKTLLSKTK
jgi:TRAP-type C4-dicarboxylate transport system substrate-binding protein